MASGGYCASSRFSQPGFRKLGFQRGRIIINIKQIAQTTNTKLNLVYPSIMGRASIRGGRNHIKLNGKKM
jgi:hypothetical protein